MAAIDKGVGAPTPRTYNTGIIDRLIGMPQQVARHPWPVDCHIQGGRDGLVVQSESVRAALTDTNKASDLVAGALGAPLLAPHYRTAFFEAFPAKPKTFLRGEGASLEAAEDSAWAQFQALLSCAPHEFERRQYRTGAGICRRCGMFSSEAFETTLDPCVVCGRNDNRASFGPDRHGRWHCEKCFRSIPEEDKSEIHKTTDRLREENGRDARTSDGAGS